MFSRAFTTNIEREKVVSPEIVALKEKIFYIDIFSCILILIAVLFYLFVCGLQNEIAFFYFTLPIPFFLGAFLLARFGYFNAAINIFTISATLAIVFGSIFAPNLKHEGLFMLVVGLAGILYINNQKVANATFIGSLVIGIIILICEYYYVEYGDFLETPNNKKVSQLLPIIFYVFVCLKFGYIIISQRAILRVNSHKEAIIRASEQNFRDIFNNIYDGIVILNNEGLITNCNKSAKKLLGLKDGDSLYVKDVVHPDDRHKSEKYFKKLKKEGFYIGYRGRVISQNEEVKYIEVNSVAIRDIDGNFLGSRDIVRDISEATKQEKLIQRQVQELDIKNKELKKYIESNMQLENFAYLASHDLKAPIRTIISFVQLLRKSFKTELTTDQNDYLNFITNASYNMNRLIEDLLAYSLVSNQELKFKEINLCLEVEQLLEDIQINIKEKDADVKILRLPELIIVDKTLIRQLFQNLIVNAIKFAKVDTPPKIVIDTTEEEDYWQFSISDNGIGISSEYHEKIFLLFKKLTKSSHDKGTGIGLAMCKSIVEHHKGRIWLESDEGYGSTFYFTISRKLKTRSPKVISDKLYQVK